ncbi:alpha/beta hydrolase family protein [Nocardia arthritidis]|uniref:Alpha/beta hydrolase fold domain-containing protein n=1 Tax=Nocardia arthritidis TaxID=228602 RepID=A0A6G9Y6S2_9NOCA|nr:alpha/beta hydrolase [Nocardia arthritidis]QIS08902.1 alpha/beta hydrolase fold domain-containing protein [Nocardia arthritidis]
MTTIEYGPLDDQVADIYLPEEPRPAPLILYLHGGYWRTMVDRQHAGVATAALARLGYVVANIEYRRGDGAWSATLDDIARAFDTLPTLIDERFPGRIQQGRIGYVGHSAGGQLALWAALRHRLPSETPWRTTEQPPVIGIVALAPVADLAESYRLGNGEGAVAAFLGGGPDEFPERYAAANPSALGPVPVPTAVVHGDADQRVPIHIGRDYCALSGAELVFAPGIDHFQIIDPASAAWTFVTNSVLRLISPA